MKHRMLKVMHERAPLGRDVQRGDVLATQACHIEPDRHNRAHEVGPNAGK